MPRGLGLRPGAKAPDEPPTPYRLRVSPRLYSGPGGGFAAVSFDVERTVHEVEFLVTGAPAMEVDFIDLRQAGSLTQGTEP